MYYMGPYVPVNYYPNTFPINPNHHHHHNAPVFYPKELSTSNKDNNENKDSNEKLEKPSV